MTKPTVSTPRPQALRPWVIVTLIVVLWAMAIYALAAAGWFQQSETDPPTRVALAFFAPVVLFGLAYRLLPALRDWVGSLDLALLVGAQAWRVLGMVFLFLMGLGLVPATFAIPAGVGDIAVGVFAVFVLIAVLRQSTGWVKQARLLVYAGVLDFAVALTTATLSGKGWPLQIDGGPLPVLMQTLPMALIPTFAVPMFMILHLMVWLKLPSEQPAADPAQRLTPA